MPPKKAASKQKAQEEQSEDTLQAVVLTDSFEARFAPFTWEKPRCLLPVANIPLIEYTLEFLANTGIKDVFVYSSAHEDQVEEYINNSRWKSSTSPFSSLIILRCPATSTGDFLRDLDEQNLITGDFVLVSGDVIANIDINSALSQHRARREKDKSAIMTMILREVGRDCRSKPTSVQPFFFIDPRKDRCMHYEEVSRRNPGDRRLHLNDELLSIPEIDMRGDLLDCYIDICTPDVLGLWTDNFDYKSLRSSFLRGVLQDYELNGKTIHTHVIDDGYAARVSSLRTYDAIIQDIIDRWTFPFTPDCNLLPGLNFRLNKRKVYTESGVVLARGGSIGTRSIIGKDTSIGDKSYITGSVLGRRCQIGKNVKIEGSYIWDDVVIGDNSVVTNAVIANEVVVGSHCIINEGCLLSFRVLLGKGIQLPPKTKLTDAKDGFSRDGKTASDTKLVGQGGSGRSYESDSDTSEVSNALRSVTRKASTESLESMSTMHSKDDSDFDTGASIISTTDDVTEETKGSRIFLTQAITSIQDGILKGDDPDTVKLELLGQRLTRNATDADMRDAIARALITSVFTFMQPPTQAASSNDKLLSTSPSNAMLSMPSSVSLTPLSPADAVAKVYKTYSPVLVQLGLFDSDLEAKTDQVAVLREIEKECAAHREGQKVLLFTLNELHTNLDILQDEGLLQWWDGGVEADEGSGDDQEIHIEPHGMEVRKLAVTYMERTVLAEDDDEDEESSEEDDEDESD